MMTVLSYTLNTIDRPAVMCLNDQGGQVLEVTRDKTATLRAQEHGHQPIIACGFDGNQGAKAATIGFTVEGGTLEAGKIKHVLILSGHCAQEIQKE